MSKLHFPGGTATFFPGHQQTSFLLMKSIPCIFFFRGLCGFELNEKNLAKWKWVFVPRWRIFLPGRNCNAQTDFLPLNGYQCNWPLSLKCSKKEHVPLVHVRQFLAWGKNAEIVKITSYVESLSRDGDHKSDDFYVVWVILIFVVFLRTIFILGYLTTFPRGPSWEPVLPRPCSINRAILFLHISALSTTCIRRCTSFPSVLFTFVLLRVFAGNKLFRASYERPTMNWISPSENTVDNSDTKMIHGARFLISVCWEKKIEKKFVVVPLNENQNDIEVNMNVIYTLLHAYNMILFINELKRKKNTKK